MKINGYPKLSEIVASNGITYSRQTTRAVSKAEQLAAMLDCGVSVVTDEEYESMTKDSGTLYIVTSTESCVLYFGELPIKLGGGGETKLMVEDVRLAAKGFVGTVAFAKKVE